MHGIGWRDSTRMHRSSMNSKTYTHETTDQISVIQCLIVSILIVFTDQRVSNEGRYTVQPYSLWRPLTAFPPAQSNHAWHRMWDWQQNPYSLVNYITPHLTRPLWSRYNWGQTATVLSQLTEGKHHDFIASSDLCRWLRRWRSHWVRCIRQRGQLRCIVWYTGWSRTIRQRLTLPKVNNAKHHTQKRQTRWLRQT